jgi:hypothetical protein
MSHGEEQMRGQQKEYQASDLWLQRNPCTLDLPHHTPVRRRGLRSSRSNKEHSTMKSLVTTALLAALWAQPAQAQSFQNLNFESATVSLNNPVFGFLDWSLAAPGWNHSAGDDTSTVYYRLTHAAPTQWYLLVDSVSRPENLLAGRYSMSFVSGFNQANPSLPSTAWVNAYVSQTGLVPANTRSINLLATGPIELYAGGNRVPLVSMGGNLFAGDISSFAGATTELKFLNSSRTLGEAVVLDNIQFSTVALVPEPSMWMLLGAGSLYLLLRRGRAARTNSKRTRV